MSHCDSNTGRQIGYMRISTDNDAQTFNRQQAQLEAIGLDALYSDKMSGAKRSRPQLDKMLEELQAGDTVHIVSIDRLSRSTKDLLDIVEVIKDRGASIKSIQDAWLDSTSDNPMSTFLMTIMGALAEMERAMINKRVNEGIAVAKQKGVRFGRPTKNKNKVNHALELYHAGEHTTKEIADITGVSKATLYRKLKEQELQEA
ncbi:recombinase family protein [Paraliobacillus ryukyuensis]|uniref:recombinase family protein n=1 Tax=Paraliobacillus ryukyuensis TaxID=200904 RepID=UPI0009A80F3C|nr:recombinase family protein [Paraliobacillus ryukyuensis]